MEELSIHNLAFEGKKVSDLTQLEAQNALVEMYKQNKNLLNLYSKASDTNVQFMKDLIKLKQTNLC